MAMKLRPVVLTVPLIAAGLFALVGCLYIPTFNAVVEGQDASKKVGEVSTKRPIRVTVASQQDVLRILGAPRYASESGNQFVYAWTTRQAIIMVLCYGVWGDDTTRASALDFDDTGILSQVSPVTDLIYIDTARLMTFQNPEEFNAWWNARWRGRENLNGSTYPIYRTEPRN